MKKIPMRRCLATNESFPKKELLRIVRTPEGEVKVDQTGKLNGKGAYISRSKEALEIARKRKFSIGLWKSQYLKKYMRRFQGS